MFDVSTVSKAIAAGIVAALVGVAARYGFQPKAETVTAAGVIITAVVSYVAGHVIVYFSPANKRKI